MTSRSDYILESTLYIGPAGQYYTKGSTLHTGTPKAVHRDYAAVGKHYTLWQTGQDYTLGSTLHIGPIGQYYTWGQHYTLGPTGQYYTQGSTLYTGTPNAVHRDYAAIGKHYTLWQTGQDYTLGSTLYIGANRSVLCPGVNTMHRDPYGSTLGLCSLQFDPLID